MWGVRFIAIAILAMGLAHGQATNVPPDIQAALAPYKPVDLADAFREACWKGDLAIATRLLDAGVPIEGRDSSGRTGLFEACHGDPDVVKMLIARGAKVDVVAFNGDTTMGRACEFGDLASAQMLLAAGADLSKANKFGRTPLMLAAREGHDDLVAFLIAQHVDVNVESPDGNALTYAVWKDHLSIAKMLIDAGARENPPPADGAPPTAIPLMGLAALTNDTQLMDLLLTHGADIKRVGKDGMVPLVMTVEKGKPEAVAYLLEKGADPLQTNRFDENALLHATLMKRPEIMKVLVDHHVPLETKDSQGRTALIWACCHMDDPEIQLLVGWGADVNAIDSKGETPLSYVNDRGDTAMAQLLLSKGAKPQEPHIIDREKSTDPLTPVQTWAMAVGAFYNQFTGHSHHVLGAGVPRKVCEATLQEYWNVKDGKSLQEALDKLINTGHRAEFQKVGAQLAAMNAVEFAAKLLVLSAADARQAKAIRASYLKWKDRSGLAWDLCRAANVVNTGYGAGYADEQQTWNRYFAIAEQTQKSFSSWQEMSDNFLDGREIWANERDPSAEACVQLLLNPKDPNSPWNQNPWKTPLSGSSAAESTSAQ